MASNAGPVMPPKCTTIELKDLADCLDFDNTGEVGTIYGLELTQDGLYKRKEVDSEEKPVNPKFNQLRDVNAGSFINGINYFLRHVGNKWTIVPHLDIKWEINFQFISPFTLKAKDDTFRKAINSGPLHVALVTKSDSRNEIAVKPYKNNMYILHRKSSVAARKYSALSFVPRVPVGDKLTMMFDVILSSSDPSTGEKPVMTGISFSWGDLTGEDSTRVIIAIQKNADGTIQKSSTNPKVTVNVDPTAFKELDNIILGHMDIVQFMYTDKILTEEEMEILTNEIDLS